MVIDGNFQTPEKVFEYMVGMIPEKAYKILEPTPGLGNIVNALVKKDKYVIYHPEDFFLMDRSKRFDCVVMNPPFSSKTAYMENAPKDAETLGMKLGYHILLECMKMSDHVIALMPWFTIADSDVRLRFLRQFGIKSLTILPRKTFKYARVQTIVIELEKGFVGDTVFKVFDF